MVISADSVVIGDAERLVMMPAGVSGDTVDGVGPGMNVLLEETGCVLESSVVVSVGTLERRVIFSVVEMFCWMVLVSLSSGLREDVESVSIIVVSVERGTGVETGFSLELEGVTV